MFRCFFVGIKSSEKVFLQDNMPRWRLPAYLRKSGNGCCGKTEVSWFRSSAEAPKPIFLPIPEEMGGGAYCPGHLPEHPVRWIRRAGMGKPQTNPAQTASMEHSDPAQWCHPASLRQLLWPMHLHGECRLLLRFYGREWQTQHPVLSGNYHQDFRQNPSMD